MSDEEIETRLSALAQLKIHPRDQSENRAVLARAERLHAERLGEARREIAAKIDEFRYLIGRQDASAVNAFRESLTAWLDRADSSFFT